MNPSETPARNRRKTAIEKTERTLGGVLGGPDVLRAVPGDEARSLALEHYRGTGFGPDDFGRHRAARQAMADSLTRTEDRLELQGSRYDAERIGIRAVRRRLERELWP